MRAACQPIPFYRWALWLSMLGVGLVLFYGLLTPVWMLVRFVAWLSERHLPRRERGPAEAR